jgi:hypothetical protein
MITILRVSYSHALWSVEQVEHLGRFRARRTLWRMAWRHVLSWYKGRSIRGHEDKATMEPIDRVRKNFGPNRLHDLAWLGPALVARHRGVTKASEACEKLT